MRMIPVSHRCTCGASTAAIYEINQHEEIIGKYEKQVSGYLEQIECGRIQEEKGQEGCQPYKSFHGSRILKIP